MSKRNSNILWVLAALIGVPALLLSGTPEVIHWVIAFSLGLRGIFKGIQLYQGTE